MRVTGTILLLLASLIACIQGLQLLHHASSSSKGRSSASSISLGGERRFQVYGQSVINVDGKLEKSLAAVIRVPREQPSNEMPNDEPDTSSSGKNQLQYIHDTTLLVKVRKSHSVVG